MYCCGWKGKTRSDVMEDSSRPGGRGGSDNDVFEEDMVVSDGRLVGNDRGEEEGMLVRSSPLSVKGS